jgi:hypothetical protein
VPLQSQNYYTLGDEDDGKICHLADDNLIIDEMQKIKSLMTDRWNSKITCGA